VEPSAIVSADDDVSFASDRLLDLAIAAVPIARTASLSRLTQRMSAQPYYPEIWPGEHYKLLAGIVSTLRPRSILEIGTGAGLSALAMAEALDPPPRVTTFDIVPWQDYPQTCLRPDDFSNGMVAQVVADLAAPGCFREHTSLFQKADLIFIDGPKDGRFEHVLLTHMAATSLPQAPIVILDDIRVWNMIAIWRSIGRPKLDLTSFGHWSGTGIVDWIPQSTPAA
jgi:predicted O-methyltransferase YrrM